MKRIVYASYEKITDAFPVYLLDAVKQFLPKNCHPRFDLRRDKILLQDVPSDDVVKKALIKSCKELNYDTHIFMDGDVETLAAIKGQAYVTLTWFKDDEIHNGFISINLNHGNILNEDWYEDIQSATEMPAGFLKTSKFTAPSIKTDEQRNALEAFEIAVTEKYKQFESLLDRQFQLTSDTAWYGTITQYEEGYYINIEATRSSFSAFVQGDTVIRKPRNLRPAICSFDVEGRDGTLSWMSKRRTLDARTKVSKMSATELDAYIKENNLTGEYYARLANLPYTASSGDRAKVRRELVKLDMQIKGVN